MTADRPAEPVGPNDPEHPTGPSPAGVDGLGYRQAMGELEAILERLEHDEPDVDRIAADVARAAALVAHCRQRITAAQMQVEEVVGALEEERPARGEPDGADAGDATSNVDGGPGGPPTR